MSDKKDNKHAVDAESGRRDLLKKLSAGGSTLAVAKWTAPVVSAIALPVHAQTSFVNSFQSTVTF